MHFHSYCWLLDGTCVDCAKSGHLTKNYFKCELYVASTASDGKKLKRKLPKSHLYKYSFLFFMFVVGSSKSGKRKQTQETKNDKKKAKLGESSSSNQSDDLICVKCKQPGHVNGRSALCAERGERKSDVLKHNLGNDYRAFSRRTSFNKAVNDEYKNILNEKNVNACSTVRNLVFKTKLFVNYYIIKKHNDADDANPRKCIPAPKCVFTQNFWYTVIQMVNGQAPTSKKELPDEFAELLNEFKTDNPTFAHSVSLTPGVSQCITEVSTEIATSYNNAIVENFEKRLLYFLTFKLQTMFVVSWD